MHHLYLPYGGNTSPSLSTIIGATKTVIITYCLLSSFQKLRICAGFFWFLQLQRCIFLSMSDIYWMIYILSIIYVVLALKYVQLCAQCFPLEDGGRSHCALWRLLLLSRLLDQFLRADHLVEKDPIEGENVLLGTIKYLAISKSEHLKSVRGNVFYPYGTNSFDSSSKTTFLNHDRH